MPKYQVFVRTRVRCHCTVEAKDTLDAERRGLAFAQTGQGENPEANWLGESEVFEIVRVGDDERLSPLVREPESEQPTRSPERMLTDLQRALLRMLRER